MKSLLLHVKGSTGKRKKCQGADASELRRGLEHHKGSSASRHMHFRGFVLRVFLPCHCDSQPL